MADKLDCGHPLECGEQGCSKCYEILRERLARAENQVDEHRVLMGKRILETERLKAQLAAVHDDCILPKRIGELRAELAERRDGG